MPFFNPNHTSTLNICSLKDRVRSRIHTAGTFLATMETQENLLVEYLEQMSSLINDVANHLLNIDPGCRDHINEVELKDSETSILDIGYEASDIYADVYTYIANITEAGRKIDKAIKAVQHGRNHRQRGATEIAKSILTCIKKSHNTGTTPP